MEAWEDGLGLKIQQDFVSKKAVQEAVDQGAYSKSFGFDIKKKKKRSWLLSALNRGEEKK